jgi:hypothetical protein
VNDSTGLTSLPAKVSIEVVAALSFVTTSLPNGFTSVPYYAVLQGTGSFPPYKNWTVVSGALPSGLTLDPNAGTISGTPTTTAGSPFTFAITFSDGNTVSPAAWRRIRTRRRLAIADTASRRPRMLCVWRYGAELSATMWRRFAR